MKQKSILFPVGEKNVKKQTFENYGFLKYFRWSRDPYNSKNIKKWITIVWENTSIWNLWVLKYFGWSRNPCNSQNMGKMNLNSTGKLWKNTDFPYSSLPRRFRVDENPCNSMFRNAQIPIKWTYSVESHIIPRLWVFEEIRGYYETQIIHIVWVM